MPKFIEGEIRGEISEITNAFREHETDVSRKRREVLVEVVKKMNQITRFAIVVQGSLPFGLSNYHSDVDLWLAFESAPDKTFIPEFRKLFKAEMSARNLGTAKLEIDHWYDLHEIYEAVYFLVYTMWGASYETLMEAGRDQILLLKDFLVDLSEGGLLIGPDIYNLPITMEAWIAESENMSQLMHEASQERLKSVMDFFNKVKLEDYFKRLEEKNKAFRALSPEQQTQSFRKIGELIIDTWNKAQDS